LYDSLIEEQLCIVI